MLSDDLNVCQKCGGLLEKGYLLGKQNRIRWSSSNKGMTIFHGVPLIKLEKGFWRKAHWWKYAPGIEAKRCKNCRLVMFSYNNEREENVAGERTASLLIAGLFISGSVIVVIAGYLGTVFAQPIPLFIYLIFGVLALFLLILGIAFFKHSINK